MSMKKYKENMEVDGKLYSFFNIEKLAEEGYDMNQLPFSIRILLEAAIRQEDGHRITKQHIKDLAGWATSSKKKSEVPFKPARVILQDFTGVPAVVDLASMREAMKKAGGDIKKINPQVPVDLVIDHSVQVDSFGEEGSLLENMEIEFQRNQERYEFLRWAQEAFDNFSVVPPATGIVHQVNLEYLAQVVVAKEEKDEIVLYPDTLVGTDSHTTMINGLGVLGWGVGGIEAEAGMLGQPSYFPMPEVIGVRLESQLPVGTTATDLALKITQILREHGVVGKFVEFFGSGVKNLSLADRSTIANMAPEYGATCGFFPVDEETLKYLQLSGRSVEHIRLVETYLKKNHLFYVADREEPMYTQVISVDLSTISPSLSGPKRPQDFIPLREMKSAFLDAITAPLGNQGYGLSKEEIDKEMEVSLGEGQIVKLKTGSIVIAAITSCTNTSNPYVMIGAGLLAKNAVELGLEVPAYVKTSLAPGSKVVTDYLKNSGLLEYLEKLGFYIVGYGCTTCIGNSGPLQEEIEEAIVKKDLLVASVLSGNRNFEGRIHQLVKANYLASPLLVVAYALAGTVNIDLDSDSLGKGKDGSDIYLKDIWPTSHEINQIIYKNVTPHLFQEVYKKVYDENQLWNQIAVKNSPMYAFHTDSTYIQNPTFFADIERKVGKISVLHDLRVIGKFRDSVTTDHISPAGAIGINSPAGKYLLENGVSQKDFNTYGSRRGNHQVMMRGTFANIRIRNLIAPETEGGFTTYWPTKEVMTIYDACMKYQDHKIGLVVLAGKDYGMGSSRDWAAKGTALLGIKVVIAESFERIHRSNLVMMGVLPLQFLDGESADSLGLTGKETFDVELLDQIKPKEKVTVVARDGSGKETVFSAIVRFDSLVDIDYYRHGGILKMVLRLLGDV